MNPNNNIDTLALALGQQLSQRGWRVATAESCTGGWISQSITSVAGSSKWFDLGFVVYSNSAKHTQLGVSETLLKAHGAVSEPVVVSMATAARERAGADIAVAVSGIAGPGGGDNEKPVGTVWIAWALPCNRCVSQRYAFSGDRYQVREQTVIEALKGLSLHLQKNTV